MSETNQKTGSPDGPKAGSHWTSKMYSENRLMDALVKHLLGLTLYGMADVGEVLEAVSRLTGGDEENWISAWSAMAQPLQDRAEKAERSGKLVSAASAYLRASTYWRASLMSFNVPDDQRIVNYSRASARCYERYLELSDYPGEYVEIPYENGFLPGHFHRSPVAGDKTPLLIITPGNDTWAEDTRWVYDGAIRRGIHCLVYDGPGQGFALRLNDLHFRPDWENVVGPVVDFGLKFPEVDATRIGLMGMSFGGFLAPRAAAFEKRIKVCVANPGNLKWGMGVGLLQKFAGLPLDDVPRELKGIVISSAWRHGVSHTAEDVIGALEAYDLTPHIHKITCETLVLDGTAELVPGQARKFFDLLKCPKTLHVVRRSHDRPVTLPNRFVRHRDGVSV